MIGPVKARWEESVPNPALNLATSKWLNLALMTWTGRDFRAVADPSRLQHIVKRQLARDPLRADPQRARRQDIDLAFAEIRGAAAVVDHRRAFLVAEDGARAGPAAMLELGECKYIADTLSNRRLAPRSAADFPKAARDLSKRSRRSSCRRSERQRERSRENRKAAHRMRYLACWG